MAIFIFYLFDFLGPIKDALKLVRVKEQIHLDIIRDLVYNFLEKNQIKWNPLPKSRSTYDTLNLVVIRLVIECGSTFLISLKAFLLEIGVSDEDTNSVEDKIKNLAEETNKRANEAREAYYNALQDANEGATTVDQFNEGTADPNEQQEQDQPDAFPMDNLESSIVPNINDAGTEGHINSDSEIHGQMNVLDEQEAEGFFSLFNNDSNETFDYEHDLW